MSWRGALPPVRMKSNSLIAKAMPMRDASDSATRTASSRFAPSATAFAAAQTQQLTPKLAVPRIDQSHRHRQRASGQSGRIQRARRRRSHMDRQDLVATTVQQ